MSAAIAIAALGGAGIYLVLQRGLVRIVIGFLLLQHAINLLLITVRAPQRQAAPILPAEDPSDPLRQAFVLTAIVIGLSSVAFLLALALRFNTLRQSEAAGDPDDVETPDAARSRSR